MFFNWCWHKWGKWGNPYQRDESYAVYQNRTCEKCGYHQIRLVRDILDD